MHEKIVWKAKKKINGKKLLKIFFSTLTSSKVIFRAKYIWVRIITQL